MLTSYYCVGKKHGCEYCVAVQRCAGGLLVYDHCDDR